MLYEKFSDFANHNNLPDFARDMRLAVLITCHNRVENTLACLSRLMPQLSLVDKVFLVDDGSTDGTGARVRSAYPAVHVIDGDGSLYWAKGMRKAWEEAVEKDDWEAYLWLNDDTELNADAVEKMLAKNDGQSMVVGDLCDSTGRLVYGLNVDGWVNGNCVIVPRRIYETVGMICGGYRHAWADSDYALHAKRAGFAVVGAGMVGKTEWHPLRPDLSMMSLSQRWDSLFEPKGWNLHDLWLYRRRNWGIFRAMVSSVHFMAHVLCG